MMSKIYKTVRVKTWKMGPDRYLHQIEVIGKGWFYVISNFSYFHANFARSNSKSSIIIRNEVKDKEDVKRVRDLKLVRIEYEDWLDESEFTELCFGGDDNTELRKKIYGKELRTIKIVMRIFMSGQVNIVKAVRDEKNILEGYTVKLMRNPRKRIKDPLPYLAFPTIRTIDPGDRGIIRYYDVSELSLLQFKKRVKRWIELRV